MFFTTDFDGNAAFDKDAALFALSASDTAGTASTNPAAAIAAPTGFHQRARVPDRHPLFRAKVHLNGVVIARASEIRRRRTYYAIDPRGGYGVPQPP
ncbi:hypothetical protein [Nonomuraea sp. NPDC049784]|uniref:hypothetical protein n=1 Tax=Nonomuraea sp. NPDC049784 TaxID=3154361 RepID=UPI00340278DB